MKSKLLNIFFGLFLLLDLPAKAETPAVPRDTSYTLYSSWVKYRKNSPFIQPVYEAQNDGVIKISNVPYAEYEGRKMPLDVFIPGWDSKLHPVVVLIHGGGWISGNKNLTWPMAHQLCKAGYLCLSVEYRMLLEAPYPAALKDIKTAIRWIRSQAETYHVDTSFVAIYGCSAGGQLAALAASTNALRIYTDPAFYPEVSDHIQALIDLDGVLHFLHPLSSETNSDPQNPTLATRWLGISHLKDRTVWDEASALTHVDRHMPPTLFIGSQYPRFLAGSEEMMAKMDSLGIYSEIHRVENSPHPFWLFEPWFTPVSEWIVSFLKAQLPVSY